MTPIALKCKKCEHVWIEYAPMPMEVRAFCDRVEAWSKSCPSCGTRFKRGQSQIVMLAGEAAKQAIMQEGNQPCES